MSFQPYKCVHVPVKTAMSMGPWGLGIGAVTAIVLYERFGIWIFLGPALGIAGFIILIVWLANRPKVPKQRPKPEPKQIRNVTVEIIQDPYRTYTGGSQELCQGCHMNPYDRVMIIGEHRIAICGVCENVAKWNLEQGNVNLRGLER